MTRWRKIGLFAVLGVVAGLLAAVLVIAVLTRTEYGMERVRRFAVQWLEDRVQGEVRIGRISGPGITGGVTLHDVAITGPEGREFVRADSIRARYDWRTLLGGRIVLEGVTLYRPRVVLEKLPGDTIWNVEAIFADKTPGPDTGERRDIILGNARVVDGTVIVRTAWKPDKPQDEPRAILEEVPGGLVQVRRFENINAEFDRVVWESSIEEGRLFEIRRLSTQAYVLGPKPADIRELSNARVTWRDSIITFDARNVQLPSSRASAVGTVTIGDERTYYDIQIDARQIAFADIRWIDPGIPDEGAATAQVRIQTQDPKGTLWYLNNARITAPGTRLAGSVGLVTGDTLYFTQVNLRASPLNLEFLEGLLPENLPLDGLLVGTVEVTGPVSALDIRGDVQYSDGSGAKSSIRVAGLFDMRDGVSPRQLDADVSGLDLALLHALRPDLGLPAGTVSGHIQASGVHNQPFRFAAELHHHLAGLSSSVTGAGTWDGRSRALDLQFDALPVSFEQLAHEYPVLRMLRGEARGPVKLSGSIDDLAVDARLETVAGVVDLDGRLRSNGGKRTYEGEGRVTGFQLERLLPDVPMRDMTGTIRFDMTGTSLADATGSISIDLDSASLLNTPLRDVMLVARTANGLLTLDTARAFTPVGLLAAHGTFGIGGSATGELAVALHADTALPPGMFEDRPAPGRIDASGMMRGSISAFDLDANATVAGLEWDRIRAQKADATFTVRHRAGEPLGYRGTVAADTVTFYGQELSTGTFQIERLGDVGRFVVDAGSAERVYRASADFRRDSVGTEVFVRDVRAGSAERPWVLEKPFRIVYNAPSVQLDSFALSRPDGAGRLHGDGTLGWGENVPGALPLNFRLAFNGLPLGDYVRLLREEATTRGLASGSLSVAGYAHDPVMQARIDVDSLRYADALLDRAGASVTYASRALNLRVEAERNNRRVLQGDGRIPVDLALLSLPKRALDEPMQLSLRADSMPAAVPAGLVGGFENVGGWINGNLQLGGTPVDPTIGGLVRLAGGTATFLPLGVRYRDMTATLEVLDDSLVSLTAAARADEGRTTIAGKIIFGELSDPQFDLTFDASDFPAAHRNDVDAITSGRFHLGGRYSTPVISGRINIDRGALYLDELYRQYHIVQLDSAVLSDLFSVVDTSLVALKPILQRSNNPFLRNLEVRDLQLNVGGDSWMRSRALNVQVAGNLDVVFRRADDFLRLAGSLQAMRGTYLMEVRPFARRFDIQEGTVNFPGTPGLDPDLSFRAAYRARPVNEDPIDIIAVVSGTMRAPRVRLESDGDANLSESDLASYLFFGMPAGALSSSQSRSLEGSSTLAGLGLSQVTNSLSGYLSGGLQTVAQDFGLLDYVSLTAAEAVPNTQQQSAIASIFQNTRIEFGRNLFNPNLFVIWSQRLDSGSQPGVRLEWRFSPTYSAEFFREDRFARNPSFGLDRSQKEVYGFFLFREWGR